MDYAKRSFYSAVNVIFAKVERLASEEVILQLVVQKCVPVFLYGLEVCALPTRTLQALDFTMNRVLMKLFKTSNTETIEECRYFSISNCHLCSLKTFSEIFITDVIRIVHCGPKNCHPFSFHYSFYKC